MSGFLKRGSPYVPNFGSHKSVTQRAVTVASFRDLGRYSDPFPGYPKIAKPKIINSFKTVRLCSEIEPVIHRWANCIRLVIDTTKQYPAKFACKLTASCLHPFLDPTCTAKLLKQVILIRTAQYVRPRKSMLKKGTSAGTYWNQGVRLLIKYTHVVRHCETEGGRLL